MTPADKTRWGQLPGSYGWLDALRLLEAQLAEGAEREVRAARIPSEPGRHAVYRVLVRKASAEEATS